MLKPIKINPYTLHYDNGFSKVKEINEEERLYYKECNDRFGFTYVVYNTISHEIIINGDEYTIVNENNMDIIKAIEKWADVKIEEIKGKKYLTKIINGEKCALF